MFYTYIHYNSDQRSVWFLKFPDIFRFYQRRILGSFDLYKARTNSRFEYGIHQKYAQEGNCATHLNISNDIIYVTFEISWGFSFIISIFRFCIRM